MTSIGSSNPLTQMLDDAFSKFDRNKDGKLDKGEFQSFNEVLKPGIAVDENGKPKVDDDKLMDKNSDGDVTKDEMDSTTVLMPASLTDSTLGAMLTYLSAQGNPAADAAASIISQDD